MYSWLVVRGMLSLMGILGVRRMELAGAIHAFVGTSYV